MMSEAEARSGATAPRRGGRPSLGQSAQLQEIILDAATDLFFRDGFGATSIESIAARARISKRTFYHRFHGKADLFEAVVRRLIARWLPPFEAQLHESRPLGALLRRLAKEILAVALSREAIALHRLLLAEAQRFPELAQVVSQSGASQGAERIAGLLERETAAGRLAITDCRFAAEQFLNMVLAVPRRRALGFGQAMNADELDGWVRSTVELFLNGCRPRPPGA